MTTLRPGTVLDSKYRIREPIGSGGMGVVYAAERITLGDTVAVKCILAEKNTEDNRERFLREAQAAARIRHPNVVEVFDFGPPDSSTPYMVMEYLDGPTLARSLRAAGKFSVERTRVLFGRICAAVEAGHRRGVVHRDIKPGNVILAGADDGRETVKVLDFGLARLVNDAALEKTQPGLVMGTVSYMAPEQVAGGLVSPATDVFSLAVLLYEMVTGRLPFSDENHVAILFRISQGTYDDPCQHVPGLPPQILKAIAEGLCVDPKQRPRSPELLAEVAGVPIAQGARRIDPSTLELRAVGDSEAWSHRGTSTAISGERRTQADTPPRSQLDETIFVGRADELSLLQREFEASTTGSSRIVVVVGDAGVGKTRLVDESVARLGDKTTILRGRFFAYEGDRPPAYESLLAMLSGGDPAAGLHETVTAPHIGPADVEGSVDPEADKWAVFANLAQQFVARANGGRLLVAMDDLQWATALDLEFLAYLPHATRPAAIAIVGTALPGGSAELQRWRATLARQRALLTIQVEPLTLDEVRRWLRGYFGLLRIRPRDVRRIHHASAGNPFALVEVVRDLVDRGTIAQSEQGWACEDLYDVAVPDTVHALFRARLDAANPQAQEVLAVACVVGQQFRFETLQVAGEFDELELERVLEGCVKARILSNRDLSPGADYRFVSEGMRRVLYEGLPPRARKRSHRRVVAALGSLYAADGDTRRLAQVLAYHHRAVGDWPETLHHALIAARDHLASHGHDAAETTLNYAREAAEALDADGRPEVTAGQRAQLLFIQGTLNARVGRADNAQTELLQAVDAAESIGDANLVVDTLLALAEAHLGRGHFSDGVATGMRAIGAAQGAGDRRREFAARIQVARCATPLGRLDDTETILAPVLASVSGESERGLSTTRAFALREMALVHAKRGSFIAAVKTAKDALLEAKQGGDSLSEYRAVSALGFVHAECGRYEVAVEHLERALQLARALSLRRREGIELCNLGETMHLAGDTARGLALVRSGLAIFIEISDGASEGDCRVNIGRMLVAMGQHRDAVEMLETGRRACRVSGRAEYEGIALCALADLRLAARELLEAHDLFEDARQVLSHHGAPLLWQAELGLARVASRLGHSEVAQAHAKRARDLVEAQLAEVPPGQRSHGLAAAHEETLRALSDDSPTQTVV